MKTVVSFSDFIFDCSSGELCHLLSNGKKNITRLQPQSAKLLELLIDKHPNLVSKEEIKTQLWPEVKVDFDNSLHFCIRQIRSTLNDDASNPKFIETLPRRGYRWMQEVKGVQEVRAKKSSLIPLKYVMAGLALFLLSYLAFEMYKDNQVQDSLNKEVVQQTCIGIMPIQTTDSSSHFFENTIAFDLLEMMGNNENLSVIGPTSTVKHVDNVYDFIEEGTVDFVVNGKFSNSGENSKLLIEIIRAKDGAHTWVTSYDQTVEWEQITAEIYNGLMEDA